MNIQSPEFIEGEYSIYNLSGQLIATGKLSGNTQQMTIQQTGYYLINIRSNGSTITKKIFLN
ncbi:MAG TPA: T9SS type A sorting domain-containing protein [Bacteroidetes bacterium]|nr:T9SS type A sorting domain-containing protein [Bacteroidota bacterium]